MKVLIIPAMAIAVTLAYWSAAPAAGPPGGLNVSEQNVDASGSIRVHEQGTANVNVTNSSLPVTVGNLPAEQNVHVTNSPLEVSGNVDVGNLPLDQSGNVKVAVKQAVPGGRIITLLNPGAVVPAGVSYASDDLNEPKDFASAREIDTSDCRSLSVMMGENCLDSACNVAVTPSVFVNLHNTGIGSGEAVKSGSLFFLKVVGTQIPFVAPAVKVLFSAADETTLPGGAIIFCGP
jgi:hypothetical protein